MDTLDGVKFMGRSNTFVTKSGRSNSVVELILEGEVDLTKDGKKVRSPKKKKKKGHPMIDSTFYVIFRPKIAQIL